MSFVLFLLEDKVRLDVRLNPGNGYFELLNKESLSVSGRVTFLTTRLANNSSRSTVKDKRLLSSEDIYKELSLRGYNYGPAFKNIQSASDKGKGLVIRTWRQIICS